MVCYSSCLTTIISDGIKLTKLVLFTFHVHHNTLVCLINIMYYKKIHLKKLYKTLYNFKSSAGMTPVGVIKIFSNHCIIAMVCAVHKCSRQNGLAALEWGLFPIFEVATLSQSIFCVLTKI